MAMQTQGTTGFDPVMFELANIQSALFSYICALTGHSQDARDILQETTPDL